MACSRRSFALPCYLQVVMAPPVAQKRQRMLKEQIESKMRLSATPELAGYGLLMVAGQARAR